MFVEKSDLFQGLSQELQDAVRATLSEISFDEGEHVFEAGDSADYFYVLESGRVRMTVGAFGSVSKTVTQPGDAFGLSSLIGHGTYTATAECLVAARILRASGGAIRSLLEKHPSDGVVFYHRLAGMIRRRLIDSYRILLTYDAERTPHSYG